MFIDNLKSLTNYDIINLVELKMHDWQEKIYSQAKYEIWIIVNRIE